MLRIIVGDALDATAHRGEQGVRLEAELARGLPGHQVLVEPLAHLVDGPLGRHRVAGQVGVGLQERPDGVLQHRDRGLPHLAERLGVDRGMHLVQLEHAAGHTLGVVADALQFDADLERGVGEAQVSGGRLLAHQELEREAIQLLLEIVDPLVSQDHQVGGLLRPVHQRVECATQCPLALLGHFPDRLADQGHVVPQACFELAAHRHWLLD